MDHKWQPRLKRLTPIVKTKLWNSPEKAQFSLQDKDLMKTPKALSKKLKKKSMHLDLWKVDIYLDLAELKVMLDHISLVDPNKLLLPISFKSISTKPKPRFKKTLFPEFLKFQKFLRLRQ